MVRNLDIARSSTDAKEARGRGKGWPFLEECNWPSTQLWCLDHHCDPVEESRHDEWDCPPAREEVEGRDGAFGRHHRGSRRTVEAPRSLRKRRVAARWISVLVVFCGEGVCRFFDSEAEGFRRGWTRPFSPRVPDARREGDFWVSDCLIFHSFREKTNRKHVDDASD